MEATDIMTSQLVTLSPTSTVREAIRLIEDLEIRHLPIVDEGKLIGMVSDRDLREYRLPLTAELDDPDYASDLLETPISQVMRGDVISLDSGESLRTAVDLMLEYGVGAVPVIDRHSEELMGIVSYVDVLRAVRPSLDD